MHDDTHETLKDLLLEIAEAPPEQRRAILQRVQRDHADLVEPLSTLLPAIDAHDDELLGAREDAIPDAIGRYRVQRRLARGGMGEVYLGIEPPPLGRTVALKVIRSGFASRSMVRRFEFERDALRALEHPNIARIIDGGQTGEGLPFLAMEFVDGLSLTEFARSRALDLVDRLGLVQQICEGVSAAHMKGFVHRDLKPNNIIVASSAQGPLVKIIDFGIAKLLDNRPSEGHETAPGFPVGTLEYMSPEQARGPLIGIDRRSDVYSLGVLVYELVTGELPRTREELLEWSDRCLPEELERNALRPPSSRITADPGPLRRRLTELDWIVAKALDPDPEARYRGAEQFGDDLASLVRGEAVLAAPPSFLYRSRKFLRRNRTSTIAVAAIGFALLSFTTALALANSRVASALDRAEAALADRDVALDDANAAVRFLGGILAAASPFESPEETSVAELVDSSAERIAGDLADSPQARWRVRTILAETYRARGDFARSLATAEEAITDAIAARGTASFEYAEALRVRSSALRHLRRFDEAISDIRAAIAIFEQRESLPPPYVLSARASLAELHDDLGDTAISVAIFEECVSGWDRLAPDNPGGADARVRLADRLAALGRLDEARARLDEAWEWHRTSPKSNEVALANLLARSVEFSIRDLDLDRAAEHAERLVEYNIRWSGPSNHRTLSARLMQVEVLALQGQPAEQSLPTVAEIHRQAIDNHGEHAPIALYAAYALGTTLTEAGREPEAIVVLQRLVELQLQHLGQNHVNTSHAELALATALAGSDRRGEARTIIDDVERRAANGPGADALRAAIAEARNAIEAAP